MVKWSGKRITGVALFRKVSTQGYEHLPFIILYCIALYLCYQTIGEQYTEALSKAENLEINIIDPQERLRKTAESFLSGAAPAINATSATASTTSSFTPSFFVPSQWIPGFWPSFFLGMIAIFHSLLMLLQRWSIRFACIVKYRPEKEATKATHARITPQSHLGKEELVKVERSLGGAIYFEFHRRKYLYDPKTDSFEKVRCKVNYPVEHYIEWHGIPTHKLYTQLKDLYGPNQFKMASPTFMDLYIIQITSPFTVFQLFCAILWLLDEYWKYSLFNLFMICTFEATTVFTRLKSLSTLKGMGNEARNILCYREKQWVEISTEDLVPGDIFSIVKLKEDIVPCDALLIRGSVVVNESSLTGESIPQMKDGLATIKKDADQIVSIKGVHKAYTLYGGTRILQVNGQTFASDESEDVLVDKNTQELPSPPDGGCICYCVRTGFSSSQGKLVRMIENSTASVAGDVRDTVFLLLFLLIFALSASGYVLYKGMQDGTKSRYQLLLHCILIVTSVIPPELPMQTALAVNSSLMTLMQMQIFCTEPFRVPISGKVDTCIFDKTGTITTDELVVVGVVPSNADYQSLKKAYEDAISHRDTTTPAEATTPTVSTNNTPTVPIAEEKKSSSAVASTAGMTMLKEASSETVLILGACHSLVLVDGKVAGDPLEVASMKGIKWELVADKVDTCRPRPESMVVKTFSLSVDGRSVPLTQVKIVARHHFSSKLQRMSVVVTLPGVEGGYALVKGSPEALHSMCHDTSSEYMKIAGDLAKRGMRVIALGYRRLSSLEVRTCIESRNETENNLKFVGFVSFTCRVRKDSGEVIRQLREGGCTVAMATGDAILTGVHVAREVGITTESKQSIKLLEHDTSENNNAFYWVDYETGSRSPAQFNKASMEKMAYQSDLCVVGSVISAALDQYSELHQLLHLFVVFARMRPDEKERVLLSLKKAGRCTLMCGDGANDVGALKQAHVGIALLSGFGDLNVSKESDSTAKTAAVVPNASANQAVVTPQATAAGAVTTTIPENQEVLYNAIIIKESDAELCALSIADLHKRMRLIGIEPNDYPDMRDQRSLVQVYRAKAAIVAEEKKDLLRRIKYSKMTPQEQKAELSREQKETAMKKQLEFQAEYERLNARGESWAMWKAMMHVYNSTNEEMKKKRETEGTFAGHAGKMATLMDSLENMDNMETGDLPMIKIGDASVASPFTSKMPSIRSAVDIIRQGRCTLVTTLQMFQILALNCLISAYSLSVLHLDGIKYGDKQMTCLGVLMSVSFVTISRSKPLNQLSAVTPLRSIFHPALFLSLIGQFTFHLLTLYLLVRESKKFTPEDARPEFMKEFKPSLVNSVVFLVTAVQQVSVFVVNLKGPPFMGGLTENTPLLWSLTATFVGTFMCATEYIPQLNSWLQLTAFPSTEFRNMVLLYLFCDVVGSFLWDRLMLGIFAYRILYESLKSTTRKDIFSILKTLVWVFLLVRWIASQDYTEIMDEIEKANAAAAAGQAGVGTAATLANNATAAASVVGAVVNAVNSTIAADLEF